MGNGHIQPYTTNDHRMFQTPVGGQVVRGFYSACRGLLSFMNEESLPTSISWNDTEILITAQVTCVCLSIVISHHVSMIVLILRYTSLSGDFG